MKKLLQGTLLCAIMLVFSACQEDLTVRNIKGAYRYKASGIVRIVNPDDSSDGTKERTHMLSETGVLELVSLHDGDELLLTFNQSGAGVYNTRGTASDETLHIDPFKRTMLVDLETYDVEVSGRGEIYDNTLILYLTMKGKSTTSNKTLQCDDIQMLAQKN